MGLDPKWVGVYPGCPKEEQAVTCWGRAGIQSLGPLGLCVLMRNISLGHVWPAMVTSQGTATLFRVVWAERWRKWESESLPVVKCPRQEPRGQTDY